MQDLHITFKIILIVLDGFGLNKNGKMGYLRISEIWCILLFRISMQCFAGIGFLQLFLHYANFLICIRCKAGLQIFFIFLPFINKRTPFKAILFGTKRFSTIDW